MERRIIVQQDGQLAIEAILLLLVMVTLIISGSKIIRERQLFSKVMQNPSNQLTGMIENGVWGPSKTAQAKHPNQIDRSVSFKP